MRERTTGTPVPPRARRGSKVGWVTGTAKFSPAELQAVDDVAHSLGLTRDGLIHHAVVRFVQKVGT